MLENPEVDFQMYMHVIDQIMQEEKNRKNDLLEDDDLESEEEGFMSSVSQLFNIGNKEKMFFQYFSFIVIFALVLYGIYKYLGSGGLIRF